MKHKKNERVGKFNSDAVPRVAALSTTALYALVALEFFYMASPFAAYFYSAYGPGLDWLSSSDLTAWTTRFVLPHIVSQTTSLLVNSHTIAGLLLLFIGLIGFGIGAYRVYRGKFGNGAIIQTGLYKYIRHPQYSCLIIASFGTLLIWPRMLAVVGFAFVIMLYIALAKSEEKRCESLDSSYQEFRNRTGFFLPRFVEGPFRLLHAFLKHLPRLVYWPIARIMCLAVMIAGSHGMRMYSTNKIQGIYSPSMATISIGHEPLTKITSVLHTALANPSVLTFLNDSDRDNRRLINYVLPTDMYVSEVPMNLPAVENTTHHYHNDSTRTNFKIIFTKTDLPPGDSAEGIEILRQAINKNPIVEVWVDIKKQKVEKILPPPTDQFYNGIPVPVF